MVAIYVKSPGFDDRVGKIFVNVFNCVVGYRLASDRKSLMKEAKIELDIKNTQDLDMQKRVKWLW